MSASFSFLTSYATVAISLIGELKSKYTEFSVMPFDQETGIKTIEVYRGSLKSNILKNNRIFSEYQNILENKVFNKIEGFDYYFQEAKEETDIADSVICAFYGLGFSGKNT